MLKLVVDNTKPRQVKRRREAPPEQHCLFIQQDITLAFIDDFMVLPAERILGNVYAGLTPAVERHDALFHLTH